MIDSLVLQSPAKLNLFLHIIGRRSDGYHELQTLFQLLDFGDSLQFNANSSGIITLESPGLDVAVQDNLIVRAAQCLQRGNTRGVHIRLDKRIPTGAGLGGGSSNAATTLLALNQLWELDLDNDELQALGATLGADVPVFVGGHSAWAEGIGERLTALEMPELWYLIIAPDCKVKTAEVFSRRELTRDTYPITMAAFFEGVSLPRASEPWVYRNDCQPVVEKLYPKVAAALQWLAAFGEARLTGTGACVFCQFDTQTQANQVLAQLPRKWRGFVARGLNQSPVIPALARLATS